LQDRRHAEADREAEHCGGERAQGVPTGGADGRERKAVLLSLVTSASEPTRGWIGQKGTGTLGQPLNLMVARTLSWPAVNPNARERFSGSG